VDHIQPVRRMTAVVRFMEPVTKTVAKKFNYWAQRFDVEIDFLAKEATLICINWAGKS
jgi:hypothetical protein